MQIDTISNYQNIAHVHEYKELSAKNESIEDFFNNKSEAREINLKNFEISKNIDASEAKRVLRSIQEIDKIAEFKKQSQESFGLENQTRPVFLEVNNLNSLAELARQQRGDLKGDDMDDLLKLGADERSIFVDCRYLKVETKCETNLRRAQKIWPPNIAVKFAKMDNGKFKAIVNGGFTRLNYATLVVRDTHAGSVEIVGGVKGVPMEVSEFDNDLNSKNMTIADFRDEYGDKVVEVIKQEFKTQKTNLFTAMANRLFS